VTQRTEEAIIRFDATLSTIDTSTVLRLPETASKNLPSRGQVAVHGTINGVEFQTVLEPDGHSGHWMRVDDTLQHAAGISAGDTATLDIELFPRRPRSTFPATCRPAGAVRAGAMLAACAGAAIARPAAARPATTGRTAAGRHFRQTLTIDIKTAPRGQADPGRQGRTGWSYQGKHQPFREGNGRAQRAFFEQLASDAGFVLDWQHLDADRNSAASAAIMHGEPAQMHGIGKVICNPGLMAMDS
jgi:Domain of unknown function (DUF1905)